MRELVGTLLRDLGALVPGRRPRKPAPEVRTGMSFARLLAGNVMETVCVSEIMKDGSGIPHIRYTVTVQDQNGLHNEGSRVLALSSFLAQYRKVG
jgi:hypothetical protein